MTMVRALALVAVLAVPAIGVAQMPEFPAYATDELFGRVVLNGFSTRAGVPAVTFDHWRHRAMYTCRVCHADIAFALKAGESQISAATNRSGLHCGACHNGKTKHGSEVVFGSCSESGMLEPGGTCRRCHTGPNADSGRAYEEFARKMPRDRGDFIDWEAAEQRRLIKPLDFVEGASLPRAAMKIDRDVPVSVIGTWLGNVTFSHKKHAVWNGCELCHPEIFPVTQRGSVKFDMGKINTGQFCGVCHNKVAFPIALCQRCHSAEARPPLR